MVNLQQHIVKERTRLQHQLKNKNDKKSHAAGKGYLVDVDYCKKQGKGSFCRGLEKICIEHRIMQQMLNKVQDNGISIKQEVIMNFTSDYLDNIALVFPELANNHLHNLPALLGRFLTDEKWEPNKFLEVDDKK